MIIYESERQHRQIIIKSECYTEYMAAVIAYNAKADDETTTIDRLRESSFEVMKCFENDLAESEE